jgi:hypothetical protein
LEVVVQLVLYGKLTGAVFRREKRIEEGTAGILEGSVG